MTAESIRVFNQKIDGTPLIKASVAASKVENFTICYRELRVRLNARALHIWGENPDSDSRVS
jgi:hypothetical protein